MMQNPSRSVAELRRESERTRAELSNTVETLRDKVTDTAEDIRQKVSPEHIKAEVSDYVAEKGRHWIDGLKQQAMDNPMQALAVGTAIAVPAFKMIRSVPLPLLMIGAGLALTSSRVRGAVADQVSATLDTPIGGNSLDQAADAAREGWQSVKGRAENATGQARRALHDAQDAVNNTAADVRDTTSQLASDIKDRAAEYGSAARDTLNAGMSAASEAAKEAFDATRAKAAETYNSTRSSAEGIVRDNAVLVGGIGLAIGALIAASLPSTRAEGAAMGGASDALRSQAAEAAAEKFDEAKSAAMSAAESAAGKISDAALGSDVSRATAKAAEQLKTVADETITTAFEPSQSNHR
jgi:hypothetical protein